MRLRIKEAGYTQRRLAKAIGVSESFISMVADGDRELSLERAANVALLLGCDIMELNEWHETPGAQLQKGKE